MNFCVKNIDYLVYLITQEGIIPNTKRVKGIMDLGRLTITNEPKDLIGIFQYYGDMWPMRSHILVPLTEAVIIPKGRKIIFYDKLEDSFKELKCTVYAETLLGYPYWEITFTVHTGASDKQFGAVISLNNKTIALFSIILSNPQRSYTMT